MLNHDLRITSRLLIALRQLFADQAREIWILVRGARALVNLAALFQLSEWQTTGGDEVAVIQHFVNFAIDRYEIDRLIFLSARELSRGYYMPIFNQTTKAGLLKFARTLEVTDRGLTALILTADELGLDH